MYAFITGPLFYFSLTVAIVGMITRAILYINGLNWQLDRVAYSVHFSYGLKGAFRSVFYWLIPFGTYSWRKKPLFTIIFFAFHIGAVFTPLFLEAHNVILKEKFGFSLPTISNCSADFLTWTVVVSAIFITLRRFILAEVRILTTFYDILIIFISVAPFITALIARYQIGNYNFWLLIHIIFGEIMLIAIPFTKLSHIILFFMSRIQIGMDYGIKRGGMKGSNISW